MTLPTATRGHHGAAMLRLIGAFKLFKGLLSAAGSIAALHLVHRDVGEEILYCAHFLHIDPGNLYIQRLISRLLVSPRELKILAAVFAAYSVMFLTEGTGLLLLKPWAEWMTVFTTAGLIPFEIFELYHHFTAIKLLIFLINVAAALYLLHNIRRRSITPN
jgi:uncharacterized membrane protein (DUF2068 family)